MDNEGELCSSAAGARAELGPGMFAALSALGRSGRRIRSRWFEPTAGQQTGREFSGDGQGDQPDDEFADFDEMWPGTRWRVYKRCGIACALLRRVGSEARPAAPSTQQQSRAPIVTMNRTSSEGLAD